MRKKVAAKVCSRRIDAARRADPKNQGAVGRGRCWRLGGLQPTEAHSDPRGWALTRPPPTQTVTAGAHSLAANLAAANLAAANLAAAACAAAARAADARAADALAAASSERTA